MFPINYAELLKPKTILSILGSVLVLAVLCYGSYKVYNWVYDRGHDSRNAEVAKIEKDRNDAVDKYKAYKGEYDEWVATTKNAQAQYFREQLADLKAREDRLAQAELAARNKPATIKEVIKYVPVEVDAAYRLPVGLVRLYVETLQGSTAAYSGTGLPGGNPNDVGEASGLAVSQFGLIAAYNNAECVVRGKVIEEWQGWYLTNKTKFDAVQQLQHDTAPKP